MDTQKYELSANADFTVFEFTSTGKNGVIRKAIKYSKTLNENVYNLGFGDIIFSDETTIEVDDTNLSNNGDLDKVIATVVYSIYVFTQHYPEAYVLFGSSNPAKVRLHRMIISRNYEAITKNFLVFGAVHNEQGQLVNVPFSTSDDVKGYFVTRI
jgi:hypothetical protein